MTADCRECLSILCVQIAHNDIEHLGDTSTLADPTVVNGLLEMRGK